MSSNHPEYFVRCVRKVARIVAVVSLLIVASASAGSANCEDGECDFGAYQAFCLSAQSACLGGCATSGGDPEQLALCNSNCQCQTADCGALFGCGGGCVPSGG